MAEGGFKLRKWLTNDSQVRAKMATETQIGDKQDVVIEEDISYAKSSVGLKLGSKGQKVLGCEWDYEADVITLDLTSIAQRAKGLPATKRNTLRLLAGVYNPLGLISPVTVSGKVIFQEICLQKCEWDEQLEGGVKKGVEDWIKGFIDCHNIDVNRFVYDHPQEEVVECSLHGFANASKKAYYGVAYLVYRTQLGRYVRKLTSKTRVASMKELSIPRLELMMTLILVKLMVNVEDALASQQRVKRSKLWLDNQAALFWIMNRGEWKQFVKHRVNEILKLSDKGDWRYCPCRENPADIRSRGTSASELKQNVLWWQGPAWLTESEESWPSERSVSPTTQGREEERTTRILVARSDLVVGIDKVIEIGKYSCIRMVLRVTARLKRFCFNVAKKTRSERKHGLLSLQELTEAEIDWIKAAQRELKGQENFKQLFNKFGLTEDSKGVIRCKGRLEYPDLPAKTKEPIILPKDHHLTFREIQRCHKKVLHCGVKSTLKELYTKFCVSNGRQVVNKILSLCVTCKKWEGTAYTQPAIANLPEFRVIGNGRLSFSFPFLSTVFVEVKGTLNSRPLTYDDNNPSEEVITPSHLIHGRRIQSLPEVLASEEEFGESSLTYTRRHTYPTKKLQHFWRRWQREYLTALRESNESTTSGKGRSPKEGDVVVVQGDGVKRGLWKMGVVEGVICGRENEVRGAHVRIITKRRDVYITRTVQKLYPIEVHAGPNAGKRRDRNRVQPADLQGSSRPRRVTALDAAKRISSLAKQEND
ncbi:hypothetical protein ACROYT_G020217 [Oculina patagonica]